MPDTAEAMARHELGFSRVFRFLQRAARRVTFLARNILSRGQLAKHLRRRVFFPRPPSSFGLSIQHDLRLIVLDDQVWSAVAAGDVTVIKAAFQQGLSISFPLRLLGPHSCARDARSNKTPLHLVPKSHLPLVCFC